MASWLSALGIVMPCVFPSLLVMVLWTTARMGFPSRTAASGGLMYTAAMASPLAYPSASAEKVLHDPSGDRTPFSVM